MASIDIREYQSDSIDEIHFAGEGVLVYNAFKLRKDEVNGDMVAAISDGCDRVLVYSKTDAENLIKALQKAIEFGWVAYAPFHIAL